MHSVCYQCGEWEPNKEVEQDSVDPKKAIAICSACGYEHVFAYLPLFVVAGPSGAGKSTACAYMTDVMSSGSVKPQSEATEAMPDVVVLESDILWGVAYTAPDEWPNYIDMWLRVCHNIHHSGRSVVLFGAGLNPDNVEKSPRLRYFSTVHYLALVCDEDELASRLRARPQWRESSDEAFVEAQLNYNRWFIEQGEKGRANMTVLNTSGVGVTETVAGIERWLLNPNRG